MIEAILHDQFWYGEEMRFLLAIIIVGAGIRLWKYVFRDKT